MNPIQVTYSDSKLRILVEEYITQQKAEFTLKGLCSYVLYWAIEDGKVADGMSLIESDELSNNDQKRVETVLEAIIADSRIEAGSDEKYNKRK